MSLQSAPPLAISSFITIVIGFFTLLLGYYFARNKKNYRRHYQIMITAALVDLLFLIQYVIRYLTSGSTHFKGPADVELFIYIPILTVHIITAIIVIFLVAKQILDGLKHKQESPNQDVYFEKPYRAKHRGFGFWVFILWLLSYLGGITIFIMLYLLY